MNYHSELNNPKERLNFTRKSNSTSKKIILNAISFQIMYIKNIKEIEVETVEDSEVNQVYIQWLIDDKIGHTFAMRRFTIKKGGHTPLHSHDWEHEVYILEGDGVIKDKDENEYSLKPGNFAYVEPNEIHQFINRGVNDFIFLCLIPLQ